MAQVETASTWAINVLIILRNQIVGYYTNTTANRIVMTRIRRP